MFNRKAFRLLTAAAQEKQSLIVLISLFLVSCKNPMHSQPIDSTSISLSEECRGAFAKSISFYEQGDLEGSSSVLKSARRSVCNTQHELARVEQLLASVYLQLNEVQLSLQHIQAAINRNALGLELQKKSIYLAAQLSYLAEDSHKALAWILEYETLVPELIPAEQVLKARCYHALGETVEAISIMTGIYARYKSGEIEMQSEWLEFFEGMQREEQASFG